MQIYLEMNFIENETRLPCGHTEEDMHDMT